MAEVQVAMRCGAEGQILMLEGVLDDTFTDISDNKSNARVGKKAGHQRMNRTKDMIDTNDTNRINIRPSIVGFGRGFDHACRYRVVLHHGNGTCVVSGTQLR